MQKCANFKNCDPGLFTCQPFGLTYALQSTDRYSHSYRHRPIGEPYQLETDGGLSIFSRHPITRFTENEWNNLSFINGIQTMHGSTFSRIALNDGSGQTLDVYNVHLLAKSDECDRACRRAQLQELRAEILANSRTSGNPVLVMGDFNIGGPPACAGNPGYNDIMEVLGHPRDLWMEYRRGEFGYTYDVWLNTTARATNDKIYRERIDYLFAIEDPALTNSTKTLVVRNPSELSLVSWRIDTNGPHVSDHFGIEARLEIRRRGRVNTTFRGLGGKCMEVRGGFTTDGTPIQLFDCNGTLSQQWTLTADSQLIGLAGKCLTVAAGSSAARTTGLQTCASPSSALGAWQRFDYAASGELRSRALPSSCIEVAGGSIVNRTPIQLYPCNGTASQIWSHGV